VSRGTGGSQDRMAAPDGRPARLRRALLAPLAALRTRSGRADRQPRVAFTREDARRLNERFALLDRRERRAIVRAVNRGEAMAKKRDAELAIGIARRQQRFWTRAWLLGPAIAVVQVLLTPIGWLEGLLLGAWGSVLLGMMAAWWWTRARRSEMLNVAVLGSRGSRGPTPTGTTPVGTARVTRSRLPGGRPRVAERAESAEADTPEFLHEDGPLAARPPRPRGRKRR